jgi:hypothetical protein
MPRGQRPSRSAEGQKAIGSKETAESRRVRMSVTALVALVGALLAAAISGTTLAFTLLPGLKPDPKEKVGADLAVLALDKNVDYGEYRERPGRKIDVEANPRKHHPGNVFYLRAHIEGFKRGSLRLQWFTYNPDGERRPRSGIEAGEKTVFEPDAPINTQVAQIWVREPGSFDLDGEWDSDANDFPYFVRFELYSDDVLLAFRDSPKFHVG